MSNKLTGKFIVWAILASFVISLVPVDPAVTSAAPSSQAECQALYNKKNPGVSPPPGFPVCNDRNQPFNAKLYKDQQVVAYGTVEVANPGGDDFKTKWQELDGTQHKAGEVVGIHPYFRDSSGTRGEYRYYGWDKLGNKYSNPYFFNDATSGVDPDLKKWIYRPWQNDLTRNFPDKPREFSPFFSRFSSPDEIYQAGGIAVAEANKLIHSNFVDVTYQASAPNAAKDMAKNKPYNLFDFMYVEQSPSTWADGSGRMYHKSNGGKIWYQSFAIDKLTNKTKPGVTATITPDSKVPKTADLKTLPKNFTWTFKLTGVINDKDYWKDPYLKAKYYTRLDNRKWVHKVTYAWPGGSKTDTFTTDKSGDLTLKDQKSISYRDLSIPLTKDKITKGDKITIDLVTTSYYQDPNSLDVFDTNTTHWEMAFDGTPTPPPPPQPTPDPDLPPPQEGPPPLVCSPNIPGDAFDIVEFPASDGTDLSRIESRSVSVDGVPIDADLFFSGGYVFGDDADGLRNVSISWTPKAGEDVNGADGCNTYRIINVHDTKPRAQFKLFGGTFKENRKMSIDNTSTHSNANDPFVQATYPIIDSAWSWTALDGSDSDRRMKVDDPNHKEFLYKKNGEYQVTLTVTNALGRTSDPYVLPFSVIPDEAPAVIFYPYSSQVSRNDPVTMFNDAVSTDGDIINKQEYKVYYDAAGDGSYSELIDSYSGPFAQYKPAISNLGRYRIVATIDENFGQETFPEFITEADKRITTKQFEFEVDNYIPYADISTDIPSIRQQIDAGLLLDKNLAQSKIDYIKSNGVTINNQLRAEGIDPALNVWDMHTYTYSQPASTVVHTGSYPPPTYYHCSGGYCGTLNRQSVSDNGYYHDFGSYVTVVDVPAHTDTVVDVPGHYETRYRSEQWCSGYSDSGLYYDHPGSCNAPGSSSYTKQIPYQAWVDTTYKTINVPTTYKQVWSPNVRWVSDWYGTYSGTIYKDVRQPYSNPYSRATADKYLIYISDNTINESADFNKVKGLSDAKIILVGSPTIKTQSNSDHFIENNGQSIEDIIKDIVSYIASNNPPTASQYVLLNQSFNLVTDESDPENDAIVQKQSMYVHDENFFDNPTGHASFALSSYSLTGWSNESLKTSFAQPGEYRIFRRVQDQPSTDPELAKYRYWSNDAETIIRAHRKPIAKATLDWTYDLSCTCYQTTWVDESYDLDHNVSDPVQKGIVERKIKYTVNGESYYQVPDRLTAGSYHLEYLVKDVEGAWSDPFLLDFSLAASPPPQLKAKLKSTDSVFNITGGVPASESVTAYELWTRFPRSLDLQFTMGSYINKTAAYFSGTKKGTDIDWDDVVTQIPATVPDGSYAYRVTANGSDGATAHKDFVVKVLTPINLVPGIKNAEGQAADTIIVGYPFTFTADTTEYPNQVTLTAFKGKSFQKSLSLTGSLSSNAGVGSKQWSVLFTPTGSIPDGTYTFEWTARTANGNVEVKTMQVKLVNNTPPFGDFTTFTYDADNPSMPVFEGDTLNIRSTGVGDNERDPLTIRYEIFDPAGGKRHDQTFNSTYPYIATGPGFSLPSGSTAAGTWTIRQTISDGKAAPVIKTKSVLVRALGVQGYVRHTAAWEANRLRYNEKHPKAARPSDWFWAGEAFVLEAMVTDTATSGTKPIAVKAAATPALQKNLAANTKQPTIWTGLLKEEDTTISFEKLPEGIYTFVFTVTYSNGVTKTSTAAIKIQDTVDHYVQVHRLQ